jgi:hypothetical protein
LDFREDSEVGFPSSASTEAEEECVARVHVMNQINWQLKANNIIVACTSQAANKGGEREVGWWWL